MQPPRTVNNVSTFQLLADRLEQMYETPAYQWACKLPECDGLPHQGHNYKHARTKQRIPEGDWFIWLLLCGRGFGKTRTGSEAFLDMVLTHPKDVDGIPTEWLIAGPTHDDTIKLLFEGVSSLKHTLKRRNITYKWNKNEKLVTLATGQRIIMQYAEGNEDLGRGGNWAGVWLDEIGTFKKIRKAWDESILFSIRAVLPGDWRPRIMLTTTPKASAKESFDLLWEILNTESDTTRITRGTTWENEENIPTKQLELWKQMFPPGTRSRRQELDAELMRDVDGSLWTAELIAAGRVKETPEDVIRRIVAVDPSYSSGPTSDLAGIVLVAKTMREVQEGDKTIRVGHFYVEQDLSCRASYKEWAQKAITVAVDNDADVVVEMDGAQKMNSGALRDAARDLGVNCPRIIEVNAGSVGSKANRAAPVAALYENGRVHHVGFLQELETQQTTWVPELTKKSPDRIDALVWAVRTLDNPPRAAVPILDAW